MKKVFCLIDHLSSGGAQRQLVTLAIGLSRVNWQVTLYYYGEDTFQLARLENESVLSECLSAKNKISLILKLAKKIKNENPDYVIAYLTGPSVLAIISARLSGAKPAVIVSERNMIRGTKSMLRKSIALQLFRFASAVVVNAEHIEKELRQKSSFSHKKLITIRNGLDLNYFRYNNKETGDKLAILGMSSLSADKQIHVLAKSLPYLQDKIGGNFIVKWACRRSNNLTRQEQEYKEHIDSLLYGYKLTSNWEWLPESKDVRTELQQSDVLAHPATRDGLSNSIIEAMACGKPVIATKLMDNHLIVDDKINGYLFEAGNERSLADMLERFYNLSIVQKKSFSLAARKKIEQRFSAESMVNQYIDLLTSLKE